MNLIVAKVENRLFVAEVQSSHRTSFQVCFQNDLMIVVGLTNSEAVAQSLTYRFNPATSEEEMSEYSYLVELFVPSLWDHLGSDSALVRGEFAPDLDLVFISGNGNMYQIKGGNRVDIVHDGITCIGKDQDYMTGVLDAFKGTPMDKIVDQATEVIRRSRNLDQGRLQVLDLPTMSWIEQ